MRATVDAKRRAVLPPEFAPGDLLDMQLQSHDVLLVRKMKPAPMPKPKIVRRGGKLVATGGKPITNELVRRLIEDEA
jgi:hypothetical protein